MKEQESQTESQSSFLGASALTTGANADRIGISAHPPALPGTPVQRTTPEENRATDTFLQANQGGVDGNVHITAPYQAKVTAFQTAVQAANSPDDLRRLAQTHGTKLWNFATAEIRRAGGSNENDDRPVYVARLRMRTILQASPHAAGITDELIGILETYSRGRDSSQINFSGTDGHLKILISGYDPFGSPWYNIDRSNPSGAAAMRLDGTPVTVGNRTAEIQAVTFPVRYGDFDAGVVESVFRPYLTGPQAVDMIITLSLDPGSTSQFDIEGYATQNRGGAPDNNNVRRSGAAPQAPGATGANPNYVTTTLPWQQIVRNANLSGSDTVVLDTSYEMSGSNVADRQANLEAQAIQQALARHSVRQATYQTWLARHANGTLTGADLQRFNQVNAAMAEILTDLQDDTIGQGDLGTSTNNGDYFTTSGVSSTSTMAEGSGGNYLSNEIMYRVGRLAGQAGSTVPYGHIHVPNNRVNNQYDQDRNGEITSGVRKIIKSSLPAL